MTDSAHLENHQLDNYYTKPEHGWTCFHCGETFNTVGDARVHFGADQTATPGCLLKVELGAERGLLMALRKAEAELAKFMEEDTDLHRYMAKMASRHATALNDAEEAGYRRGLRDAKLHPRDVGQMQKVCMACRSVGASHCSDPANCGGPWDEHGASSNPQSGGGASA